MTQDPNPKDDPQLEQFCEWLYCEGHEPYSMSFEQLKDIWMRGLLNYLGRRMSEPTTSAEEYEKLTDRFRAIAHQLHSK